MVTVFLLGEDSCSENTCLLGLGRSGLPAASDMTRQVSSFWEVGSILLRRRLSLAALLMCLYFELTEKRTFGAAISPVRVVPEGPHQK